MAWLVLYSPHHTQQRHTQPKQNIYGTIKPLPEFARSRQPRPSDGSIDGAGGGGGAGGVGGGVDTSGPFLVAWELQADQGMAQVLLLARAAHCLQRLHAVDAGRQAVSGTPEWQVRVDFGSGEGRV